MLIRMHISEANATITLHKLHHRQGHPDRSYLH